MAGILLLDPNKDRAADIRSLLREDGHDVAVHAAPDTWAEREREVQPDLVVAASESALRIVRSAARADRGFAPPILFVEHDGGLTREPYRPDRLIDRIVSPFLREELLARVDALIRVRNVLLHRPSESTAGRAQAAGIGQKLAAWFGVRPAACEKPTGPYLEVAARMAEFADRRDAFEPGHSERVGSLCALIADGLAMPAEESAALVRAAMLHDIGKVAIPADMLHQKGPLAESQMRLIRTHPRRGAALLRALDRDALVADTVLYHHECPDGSGYYHRESDATPRTARALAVAEVFDAMTSSTARAACPQPEALRRLQERKGLTLDTDCVEALIDRLEPRSSRSGLSLSRV